ncbi:MAG: Gfo/Idh/MocA family oxidoreductase [Paracoccus sp. (in: a-proteobacteria)]|uniref:Gfo/Idh/MocA family protein n=1 Tax=Paracoccus sp. TaxID=267 RepID=UPI0039E37781
MADVKGGPIRVGLIGAGPGGWGALAHVPALRALPQYELSAVCTTRRESAEAAAQAHGVAKHYWRPEDLATDPEIDLIAVCVRVEDHAALVRLALDAGKHVYCEWPLASTTADAQDLAALADARGVVAAVGLQARFSPDLIWLRRIIAEGVIGRVVSTSLALSMPWTNKFVYNQKRASGGNFLPILGGHALEGLAFVLGEIDSLVASESVQIPMVDVVNVGPVPRDAPEHVAASGLLEGGAFFTFGLYGGPSPGTGLRWEIHGTEGDLILLPGEGGGSVQRAEFRVEHIRKDGTRAALTRDGAEPPYPAPRGPAFNVVQSYGALAEAIHGRPPRHADFAHALRRHHLVDAIYRAAATGQRQHRQPDGHFVGPDGAAA